MRYVRKRGTGTHALATAHYSPPLTAESATTRWKGFRRYKADLLGQLLEEQYGLCCYSEIRPDQYDLKCHIEHVENKSQQPQRTFDYTNLAASALDSEHDLHAFKQLGNEAFGGHARGKSDSVDMTRFISCHQLDCATFFAYLSDGRVVGAEGLSDEDKEKARYTIDLLNLNSPYLLDLRQQWWEELELLIEKHLDEEQDLKCLAGIDLIPRSRRLSSFFSITRVLFGAIAEEVIGHEAPELL